MYKFLAAMLLSFALLACQSETSQEMAGEQAPPPTEDPIDGQTPQDPLAEQQTATDVSDEELEQFVNVSSVVQEIQMEAQMEMIEIVENEGLEVDTYNQIAQAMQMGQSEDEINVSSEDMDRFESASATIQEMEMELESEMTAAIEDEGMDTERFMMINMALQQDPELQTRIQEFMGEPEMQPDQQQPQGGGY